MANKQKLSFDKNNFLIEFYEVRRELTRLEKKSLQSKGTYSEDLSKLRGEISHLEKTLECYKITI